MTVSVFLLLSEVVRISFYYLRVLVNKVLTYLPPDLLTRVSCPVNEGPVVP